MPYIVRPKRISRITTALVAAALVLCAVPAIAGAAACPTLPSSQVFAPFGDTSQYVAVPGGTFEEGATGWSLYNSKVLTTESPLGGTKALLISKGRAVSPAFCVGAEYPTYRFFMRWMHGGGAFAINLRYADAEGTHDVPLGSVASAESVWVLSPVEQLASKLPLSSTTTSLQVQLVFETNHPGLEYEIDDVYADPYTR